MQAVARTRLEEQTKLARERRRFTRLAVAAAVVLGILTAAATGGFVYALQQKGRATSRLSKRVPRPSAPNRR